MATKPRPKTGEARKTNQPLKIDLLPPSVHDAILKLRNQYGKTWQEIEEYSAQKILLMTAKQVAETASAKKTTVQPDTVLPGGFVDWDNLPMHVLEQFPDMRLPRTSLHRWYDIRVAQVRTEVEVRSRQARVIAESFAKSSLVNGDEAVINAARDTLMGVLAEDGTEAGRLNATKGLIKLGDLMQKARTNAIRDRKVTVDEQNLQLKLDAIKQKAASVIEAVEGEAAGAAPTMSREDVIRTVREIYGVA